jgi:hypothetical protein
VHSRPAIEFLAAAALLALWVMAWSFFIDAVAGPAARLHGVGRRAALAASEPTHGVPAAGAEIRRERSRP